MSYLPGAWQHHPDDPEALRFTCAVGSARVPATGADTMARGCGTPIQATAVP